LDFDRFLLDKISDALGQEQKRNFITNLLQAMRRKEIIRPVGASGAGALNGNCINLPLKDECPHVYTNPDVVHARNLKKNGEL